MSKKERAYENNFSMSKKRTDGEHPGKKRISKTIPSQAMTPRELIVRFASGLPLNVGMKPVYEGEEELPDLDRMDNIERERYYDSLREQRDAVEERIKSARIKAEKMRADKVIEERVAKRQAEIEKAEFEKWKATQKGGNNE